MNELKRQLEEARMLEALSQQLDEPDRWLERVQAVRMLQARVDGSAELPDQQEQEQEQKEDGPSLRRQRLRSESVARLQAELLATAKKLAALKAPLPEDLELFYSIKHGRGRYKDVIMITPHLSLAQARNRFADRDGDTSLDNRGKYDTCEQFAVATRTLDAEHARHFHDDWRFDQDMNRKTMPKHSALHHFEPEGPFPLNYVPGAEVWHRSCAEGAGVGAESGCVSVSISPPTSDVASRCGHGCANLLGDVDGARLAGRTRRTRRARLPWSDAGEFESLRLSAVCDSAHLRCVDDRLLDSRNRGVDERDDV